MTEERARQKWPYLFKPEFAVRRELAHDLAAGLDIVEIGVSGLATPCDGKHTSVDELRTFDAAKVKKPYALVILAIDLEGGEAALDAAKRLAAGAQIVIVEANRNYPLGLEQMEAVLAAAHGSETFRDDLDIDGTPQGQRVIVAKGAKVETFHSRVEGSTTVFPADPEKPISKTTTRSRKK